MSKIYTGMPHLNGNILCAVDFETTGDVPGYHEPIQIAIVPLDENFEPIDGMIPFNRRIKPEFPGRADPMAMKSNGVDLDLLCATAMPSEKIEVLLVEWFNALDLPHNRRIMPLAHNWPFEKSFLYSWLGVRLTSEMFNAQARDGMSYAAGLKDKAFHRGEKVPFDSVSLPALCEFFKIENPNSHDALSDCLAEAKVYRKLLEFDVV